MTDSTILIEMADRISYEWICPDNPIMGIQGFGIQIEKS